MVGFVVFIVINLTFSSTLFFSAVDSVNVDVTEKGNPFESDCNQERRNFKQLGTSKFLYPNESEVESIQMGWEEGNQYCQDSGFQMAVIGNIKEYEDLELELLQITGRSTSPGNKFWIGAVIDEAIATFVDESPGTVNLKDSSSKSKINPGDCIFVSLKKYLTETSLHKGNCNDKHWILCQFREISGCYSPPVGKETKRLLFENLQASHLYYYPKKESWSSALEICENNGMQLASIQTEEINSFIYKALSNRFGHSMQLWTSGTFWLNEPSKFNQLVWMATGEIAGPDFPYKSTWERGQPSGNVFEKCVSIEFIRNEKEKSLKWQVSDCDQVFSFLCRVPDPCHQFEDNDGAIFHVNTRKYYFSYLRHTWMDSIEFCRSIGMELLSLETITESLLVAYQVKELNDGNKTGYWTSGTDVGQRNEFIWLTTGVRLSAHFRLLIAPSANKLHGLQHCIFISLSARGITIHDADCSEGNHFVCEERSDCKLC